jgi:hypothetical protein
MALYTICTPAPATAPLPLAVHPSIEKLSRAIEHWDETHALSEAMLTDLADYHLQYICDQRSRDIAPDRACVSAGLPKGFYWSEVVSTILDKVLGDASDREYANEVILTDAIDELRGLATLSSERCRSFWSRPHVPLCAPAKAIGHWIASIDDELSVLEKSTQVDPRFAEQILLLKEEVERLRS